MNGASPDEVRAKMERILQGAEPPRSEDAVVALLAETGFEAPLRFFSSLFRGAWLTRKELERVTALESGGDRNRKSPPDYRSPATNNFSGR